MTTSSYPVAVLGPFHPYRGGIAHHTTLLARSLAAEHPVLGVNFTRLYPGLLFPGRTQFDDSQAPLHAEGVQVQRLLDSIGPHTWWRAARAIRAAGTSLLIVQWWHPFFAPAYASVARAVRRAGIRVVFLCHNVLPHESSRLDRSLAQLGLRAADGFILQSNTDREVLERLLPGRPFRVTPLPAFGFFVTGKGREEARRQLGVDGPTILFFGLIRQYKGLDVLLRAVALARQHLPVRLLVAGEFYQKREPYEALITELGIGDAVNLADRYIRNEEVETYFAASDVVVLPYRSATQSGIAQIAFCFGRPVIVTRVGGLPEAVQEGETGLVVPAEDPAALSRALVRFFETDLAEHMRPHVQHAAGAFSWQAMVDTVHDLAATLGVPRESAATV